MSNEEKKKLEEYKKKRMKLILLQVCILGILIIATLSLFIVFYNMNSVYYISYSEATSIDYKVYLKDNDLYDEEFLGEDYAYVTSLIDHIEADFNYDLNIDADNVTYDLSYKADATLQIIDDTTNVAIYKPVYKLIDEVKQTPPSNEVNLIVPISIDYNQYNKEVIDFVRTVNLNSVKASLIINVSFKISSNCEEYENKINTHTQTLTIPLNERVIKLTESQSIPTADKVIALERGAQKDTILILAIVTLVLSIISLIILLCFIYKTRNTHINYSIKIKRIVNAYKSFIQKINNVFDTTGYQVLLVNSINEMLEIRDTLQSPILMSENEDKTMTKFIIPTNNQLLYVYEVKIDNYDEIYNVNDEIDNTPLETKIVDPVDSPDIQVDDDPILVTDADIDLDDDNETFNDDIFPTLSAGHTYSFESKLILSKDEVKQFYIEIVKYVKEYGVKISRSFKHERVYQGRKLFATILYKGKTLCIAFALDSKNNEFVKYKLIDMSEYKRFSNTPSLLKVTSSRKVKYVTQILEKIFTDNNIKNKNLKIDIEEIEVKTKEELIDAGLIKKIKK